MKMDVAAFRELPILGIIRGIRPEQIDPLVETVVASGLKTVEITMNTPGAAQLITAASAAARGRLAIGAGTVLSVEELQQAHDAGATFIVLPACIEPVVAACVRKRIPVFPGALTPQEIYHAFSLGASMVKVFPAQVFGPAYFRQLRGPFADIPLLACGGVTPQNLGEYFAAGASAVSFGSSVFRRDLLEDRRFAAIGEHIKAYVVNYQALRDV